MKQQAIIHIGASALQIDSIKAAKELDLYIIVTDMNTDAPAIPYADEFHNISGDDADALTHLALEKSKSFDIVGAYGNSDFALLSIAKIHQTLSLKGCSQKSVHIALDKFKSKTLWLKKNISTPQASLLSGLDELNPEEISYPAIIKPKDSCGSQGISSVSNADELLEATKHAFAYSNEVLVEELIEGKHYDTIGVIWDGKFIPMGIGNRYFAPDPYHFPIWGHSPSDLDEHYIKKAYQITSDAALALDLNFTPIKADLIFDGTKFYVIEIAPRFHGDVFTTKMIPFSCNEKPIKNLLQLYKDKHLNSDIVCNKKIIWKAIFPKKNLEDIEWIKNQIVYKDIFIKTINKQTFKHIDNTSLLGFIWFEVEQDISFSQSYSSIEKQLGEYIL